MAERVGEAEIYEMIIRLIRELEERISIRAEMIAEREESMRVRREETGLSHRLLFSIDREYRGWEYSRRAYLGWQTRDRRQIEELKKVIPPIRAYRIILTFSIETGEGHEPFYAEVTCDTVISAEIPEEKQREMINRIINAVIKLFWIVFDAFKCVMDDRKTIWGQTEYDAILKRVIYFQKYATTVFEYAMDNLLKRLIDHGCLTRPPEEYVTRQAILKIGVEYHFAPEKAVPEYPMVHVLIEKGRSKETLGEWVVEKKVEIAEETDVDIMIILDMKVEE